MLINFIIFINSIFINITVIISIRITYILLGC